MRRAAQLAVSVLLAVPAVASAQSMTATLGQVAAKIEQVAVIKDKNVAVGEFPLTTGVMSEMGAFLADQLDAVLTGRASAGGFKIINRSQLCQVIRENKLWVDDKFDPKLHEKLGQWAGADFLIAGKVGSPATAAAAPRSPWRSRRPRPRAPRCLPAARRRGSRSV